MTKKLFALYFRLIFFSPVVWAFYVVAAGFMAFILFAIGIDGGYDNFYAVIYSLAYVEMIIVCFAFCIAVAFARKKSTLEIACLVPKEKASFICVLAIIFASWLVCLLPIAYCIVMSVVQHISAEFCIRVIIYTLLRWMTMLAFMVSMGFLLGKVVKSAFVYLLSAPAAILFSNFNESIFGIFGIDRLGMEKATTMLSIHHMYATATIVDYSAPDIDLFFLSKVLAVVLFTGLMLYTLYLICKKNFSFPSYAGLAVIIVAFGLSAYFYAQLFPTRYFSDDKLFIAAENDSGYNVAAYSGDLKLSEFSKFECTVTVVGEGLGEPLQLRLDEAFELDSVSCSGAKVNYKRDGDYLIIDDPAVSESVSSEIDFIYSGRIEYLENTTGMINIFSTFSNVMLPPTFAFLPVIDGDKLIKDYELTVKAGNTVVSNLDVENMGEGRYSLKGESNLICVFAGNFEETKKDGVTFIRPMDYTTDFDAEYDLMANREYWNLDTMAFEEKPPAGQKKVFQMYFYFFGGASAWFDDCLIVHHWAD